MSLSTETRNPANTSSFSRIESAMLHQIELIDEMTNAFPWENRPHYIEWIGQTYCYVAHTTRLLALAAARTSLIEEEQYQRYAREIREENGHELLLASDLKQFGLRIESIRELPETAFFYQTLSYLVQNENPISILGYSLTLEGLSALKTDAYYARASAAHGKEACRFLYVHSEVDKHHFRDGLKFLKTCSQQDVDAIEKGVIQCGKIYRGIISAIRQRVEAVSQ